MKFLPNKSKDYPLRMLLYWLIIWMILFLYSTLILLPNISKNGYVVRNDVCLDWESAGRFDEEQRCVEYGPPIYTPVGVQLLDNLKSSGLNSALSILIIGLILMRGKRISEKEEKTEDNF